MSHSLGQRGIHWMRADTHMHPEALPGTLACVPALYLVMLKVSLLCQQLLGWLGARGLGDQVAKNTT